MDEYIEREAAIKVCDSQYRECLRKNDWCGDTVAWNIGFEIKALPAADVVGVIPELRKTVELLHKEYEKAKQNPVVHDPLAYALYQTWKAVDGRKNGR